MIKVYNTTTRQYLSFADYLHSIVDSALPYGETRHYTAVSSGTLGVAKFACTDHGYIDGQYVYINGTLYSGRYQVNAIDADNFECVGTTYTSSETGDTYPDMDYDFYIVFLNDVETIFNELKLKTAVRGKNLRDGNGKLMFDEVALTEDRRDIFLYFLEEGAKKVFEKIHAYSKGIVNAYKFNDQIDFDADEQIGTTENEYYIHMAINEDRDNQDENMYEALDLAITKALAGYVHKEWLLTTPLINEGQLHDQRFNQLLSDVNSAAMKAEGHKRVVFNNGIL